jgi:CheY-like chemotaxis protein
MMNRPYEHAPAFQRPESLEFFCAESGDHALDFMHRNPVDLLVTDLRMPGMSGQELIRCARSRLPELKIIIMTAFYSPELREFGRDFQVTATLEKPFDIDLKFNIYQLPWENRTMKDA